MYSDNIAKTKSAQRSNSVGYTRNRAKITNHQAGFTQKVEYIFILFSTLELP